MVEAEVRCESINHGISLSILYRSEQSVQEKCGAPDNKTPQLIKT